MSLVILSLISGIIYYLYKKIKSPNVNAIGSYDKCDASLYGKNANESAYEYRGPKAEPLKSVKVGHVDGNLCSYYPRHYPSILVIGGQKCIRHTLNCVTPYSIDPVVEKRKLELKRKKVRSFCLRFGQTFPYCTGRRSLMGNFLTKPNVEKRSETGAGNGLRFGVTDMQGWRTNMEDSHTTLTSLNHHKNEFDTWSFFGVYDGHAGGEVAKIASNDLLPTIISNEQFAEAALKLSKNEQMKCENERINESNETICSDEDINNDISAGIRDGFLELDATIRRSSDVTSGRNRSGSTVTTVLITKTKFYFANCGDSRVILSRNGKVHFESNDHKPSNETEVRRIIEAGGQVVTQRVNGSLGVSRSLGDFDYKKVDSLDVCRQLVSPEPDVTPIDRKYPSELNQGDEFIVLACDGIYDVMSSADICDFVRSRMQITNNLETITSELIDTCLYLDSKDNMSVIIVALEGAPKLCPNEINKEAKLNLDIESSIKEFLNENPQSTWECLAILIRSLDCNTELVMPPGGGIQSKHIYIENVLNRLTNKPESRDA